MITLKRPDSTTGGDREQRHPFIAVSGNAIFQGWGPKL